MEFININKQFYADEKKNAFTIHVDTFTTMLVSLFKGTGSVLNKDCLSYNLSSHLSSIFNSEPTTFYNHKTKYID